MADVLPPLHSLGNQRIFTLEQKVSDLEKTVQDMRELIIQNNDTLRQIMEAIEAEKKANG